MFVRNNTIFLRPLLNIKKEQLEQYLVEREIKWIEDSSNKNTKFKRNKIRNLIDQLDDKELIKKRIYQTSKHLSRAKSYLNEQTIKAYNEIVTIKNNKTEISLKKNSKNFTVRLPLDNEVIKLFNEIGDKIYKPRFEKLENLYEKIITDKIHKSLTFANCLIERKEEKDNIFSKENSNN